MCIRDSLITFLNKRLFTFFPEFLQFMCRNQISSSAKLFVLRKNNGATLSLLFRIVDALSPVTGNATHITCIWRYLQSTIILNFNSQDMCNLQFLFLPFFSQGEKNSTLILRVCSC